MKPFVIARERSDRSNPEGLTRLLRPAFAGLAMTMVPLLLAGCSVAQQTLKVDYYQLDYSAPKVQEAEAMNVTIGIRRFGIAAAYDHDRLVQREKDLRVVQSYYHRWVNNPRMMLSDLLLRDLSASGLFRAVFTLPSDVMPNYELNGFVQEIVKDDSGNQPVVRIGVDATLLRNPARREESRVVFQKSYVREIPCPVQSAAGIAKTMSAVFQEISSRIQQDIYEGITQP